MSRLGKASRVVTIDEAGCWLSSGFGWHNTYRLIDIAVGLGMEMSAADTRFLDAYRDSEKHDQLRCGECGFPPAGAAQHAPVGYALHDVHPVDVAEAVIGQGEMADQAVEWLNEHVAPDDYAFGWHDGEFYLWTTAEWEVAP